VCGFCTRTDIVREHLEDNLRICDVSAKGLYGFKTVWRKYFSVIVAPKLQATSQRVCFDNFKKRSCKYSKDLSHWIFPRKRDYIYFIHYLTCFKTWEMTGISAFWDPNFQGRPASWSHVRNQVQGIEFESYKW
jgi:hypothetical protein